MRDEETDFVTTPAMYRALMDRGAHAPVGVNLVVLPWGEGPPRPPGVDDREAERLWDKVDIRGDNECWPWKGGKTDRGYGRFHVRSVNGVSKMAYPHRWVWEAFSGQLLKPGLVIDHVGCENTSCCNPAHLSAVTQGQNVMRSPRFPGWLQAAKTHCPHGHPYNQENTRLTRDGHRRCRECGRLENRRRSHASRNDLDVPRLWA